MSSDGVVRPVVYDGFRLLLGALKNTPRGIDRVDLSYARHLFETWPAECVGMLPTAWGIRLFDRSRALRLLTLIERLWQEDRQAANDPLLATLRADLASGGAQSDPAASGVGTTAVQTDHPLHRTRPLPGLAARIARFLRHNGLHLGAPAVRSAPRDAIYLNIGQIGWAVPVTNHWLRRRRDVRPVFMLHDVIPQQYPDLISRGGRLAQAWMMRAVVQRAAALITTTDVASAEVLASLRRQGCPAVPLQSLHLPVSDVFLRREPPDEELRRNPYFLICGAIEPRKNHSLLLKVWRRLVDRMGAGAPRLVIAGTPAHRGAEILRPIHESKALRDRIIVVTGLASPSLRRIMANALGVLMPSLAEGFGLPVIEALAVGTPVIASDLPVHREVGGDLVICLPADDDAGWADAVMSLMPPNQAVAALRRRIADYVPLTEETYFQTIGEFLKSIP